MFRRTLPLLIVACITLSACSEQGGGPPAGFAVRSVLYQTRPETVVEELQLVGSLVANESVEVRSEIDGRIDKVGFEEGQQVSAKSMLVQIDAAELGAEVAEAEANFQLAKANLGRSNTLLKQRTISPQEHDRARAQFDADQAALKRVKQLLDDASVEAPFAGIVGTRLVSPGQYISRGEKVTSLVDLDPMKLEVAVPERFLGKLRSGLKLRVSVAAYPNEMFEAEVYFIAPEVNITTRTALVKARISNPDSKLLPGMFAEISLLLDTRENAVVVPESALMMEQNAVRIFVVAEDNTVELREVKLGYQLPGKAEIVSGLSMGEIVVEKGGQKLRPGAKVEASPDSDLLNTPQNS